MKTRKVLALFLTLTMVLSLFSMTFAGEEEEVAATAPATFNDVSGHWAVDAIYKWSGYGVINGYAGLFRPNDPISRGEMACILDNMMDYQVAAKNTFTDLTDGQFYTDAVLKANAAGIIKGDGITMRPTDKISREEAAVMLGRAFAVNESTEGTVKFNDAASIASWASGYVLAMEGKGYLKGVDNKFLPKTNITRAEIVTIIDNIVKAYYLKAGTYAEDVAGTAVIKVSDVTLQGVTISENLIIAEGVGQGEVTLDSVIVKGNTVVRGGGENSVHITGNSEITTIRIEKVDGKIRIVVSDGNTVQEIEVAEGEEIIISGTVGTVEVASPNTTIVANNANIGSVNVESTASNTTIQTGSGATIGTVNAAAQTSVSGQGKVTKVNLNEGSNNSSVTTPNTQTTVGNGVTGATGGGGTTIPAGSTGTNNSSGNGATVGGSTGGGGGGSKPTLSVSDVSIVKSTSVTFSSIAAPTGVIWNGEAIGSANTIYNTETKVTTITVPSITRVTNTLVVSATGYNAKTVDYAIPVGSYDEGKLKVIDKDIISTVSEAALGDTVLVTAGTYDIGENRIVIKNGITFAGDGYEKTIIKGTAHRAATPANDIVQPMLLTISTSGNTLVKGIHFEWDENSLSHSYSALSLAGNNITVTECKITTTVPTTNYMAIVNIGRSGGSVAGEAGIAAESINFTNNIVGGTISIVPSVVNKPLIANVSDNTITAVNMESIWTYCLTVEDELVFENNKIAGVPSGMNAIKLMEKVGKVNGKVNYLADEISEANNNASILLQYCTRIVNTNYNGDDGNDNKYKTFVAAVSAANHNDTILLGAGTYDLTDSVFGKNLTIIGEGDNTILESKVTQNVQIAVDRVLMFKNLKIQEPISINNANAYNYILKFDNITFESSSTQSSYILGIWGSRELDVRNSSFDGPNGSGQAAINVFKGYATVDRKASIIGNTFNFSSVSHSNVRGAQAQDINDVVITGNTFNGNSSAVDNIIKAFQIAGDVTSATISGNNISYSKVGIMLHSTLIDETVYNDFESDNVFIGCTTNVLDDRPLTPDVSILSGSIIFDYDFYVGLNQITYAEALAEPYRLSITDSNVTLTNGTSSSAIVPLSAIGNISSEGTVTYVSLGAIQDIFGPMTFVPTHVNIQLKGTDSRWNKNVLVPLDSSEMGLLLPEGYITNVSSGTVYTSIQTAINAASDVDKILVSTGVYDLTSQLVLNKAITVQGVDVNNKPVLNLKAVTTSNQGSIHVTNTATLRNLKLIGEQGTYNGQNSLISIGNSIVGTTGARTIDNCEIIVAAGSTGTTVSRAIEIWTNAVRDVNVTNCIISGGAAGNPYGMIYATVAANTTFTLTDNDVSGYAYGNLGIDNNGNVVITGNTFDSTNSSTENVGYSGSGTVTKGGNTFIGDKSVAIQLLNN